MKVPVYFFFCYFFPLAYRTTQFMVGPLEDEISNTHKYIEPLLLVRKTHIE